MRDLRIPTPSVTWSAAGLSPYLQLCGSLAFSRPHAPLPMSADCRLESSAFNALSTAFEARKEKLQLAVRIQRLKKHKVGDLGPRVLFSPLL